VRSNASTASYPRQFDPENVSVDRTRLLVAPDNAERTLLGIIDNASESVAVEQVAIGGRHSPFLQATLDAARRGVDVRVLLSSAWYTREDNRRLVDWLNERANKESLPLTARLAEPSGQFEKIHTKGVVVDGETVVLGSMNWNNNSARDNREVALVLEGDEAGTYFEQVFQADWPSQPILPFGYLLAVGCVAAAVVLLVHRLRFEESSDGVAATDGERLTQD
jgi:phosphatidylserine/phosphatidylglycerophosphate/cardiolipin synthase-like enzyme